MFKAVVRGNLFLNVIEGRSFSNRDLNFIPFFQDLSDPWLEIIVGTKQVLSTSVKHNTHAPTWNAKAVLPICHDKDFISMNVWDDDYIGQNLIGEADVTLKPTDKFWERNEWVRLKNSSGEVHLWIKFVPFVCPPEVLKHEPLNADFLYFPAKTGGTLSLYQDAHFKDLELNNSTHFNEGRTAFKDIAEAFENAKAFICIAGWSLWTELQLRRDGSSETIGELLNRRSNEGIKVLILIWNEKFSSKLCRELFGTHDFKTVNFFKDSNVIVASVGRQSTSPSDLKLNLTRTIYTHHMKLAIADSPQKDIVAFAGGLDLTDGRWDTPDHLLWKSLSDVHKEDFYNGFVGDANPNTGPREPWHDLHSKIDGLPAYDLLELFNERWIKHVPEHKELLEPFLKRYKLGPETQSEYGRKWHIQALRTSDSDSSYFRPNNGSLIDTSYCQKDCSFHHGIISLIRASKKFIYIENQYFIGSAFAWKSLDNTCATNLVPLEIAEQITSSIKIGFPIRAYVVIPLCPEGDPSSSIGNSYMSDIIHWQYLTIQMMYQQIAETLKEVGSSDHPEDYLLFLCLGKKLQKENAKLHFPTEAAKGTEPYKWQKRSRFLIYVHSKMALIDDARIILGSANFNERSLNGSRDTEAGIAGSEIDHLENGGVKLVTEGAVAKFRRSLWCEHTSGLSEDDQVLTDPSSRECISEIKKLAEQSLFEYIDDEIDKEITFRFMKYPLKIESNGDVGPYPEIPNVPDFDLSVIGNKGFIPPNVTT